MKCCQPILIIAILTVLSPLAASAQSFGPRHMPSTCAQFFGFRYGPGHHAPMVRMPGRPQRTPRSIRQPAPCQYCASHQHARPIANQHWAPQPTVQYPRYAPPINQSVPTYAEPPQRPNGPAELIRPLPATGRYLPAPQGQQTQWRQAQRHF
jgi:hypothetical protein